VLRRDAGRVRRAVSRLAVADERAERHALRAALDDPQAPGTGHVGVRQSPHVADTDAVVGFVPCATHAWSARSAGVQAGMKMQCPPVAVNSWTSRSSFRAAVNASRYLSSFSGRTRPSSSAWIVITFARVWPRGSKKRRMKRTASASAVTRRTPALNAACSSGVSSGDV